MAHGFVHVEIPSADFNRSRAFYSEIFGWKMDYLEEADYMLFETGEGINGAFYHSPQHTGKQGLVVYIQVESLEATLERINHSGGKTVMPISSVPNQGSFALFSDPDGNVLGLWANS